MLPKIPRRDEMFKAIMEVHHGNRYICDEVKNIISEQIMDDSPSQGINALSERELQIVKLIKEGFSSKEISAQLNISLKTVEVHRHNILKETQSEEFCCPGELHQHLCSRSSINGNCITLICSHAQRGFFLSYIDKKFLSRLPLNSIELTL